MSVQHSATLKKPSKILETIRKEIEKKMGTLFCHCLVRL